MHRFEVYKDKKGGIRFRLRASNGEPMFASESYTTKASAMKAITSIKANAAGAEVADLTAAPKPEAKPAKAEAKPAKPKVAAAKAAPAKAVAKAAAAKPKKAKAKAPA